MSKLHLHLYFVSLLLLFHSSSSITDEDLGFVACRPRQIQAFKQFKNEFDTRDCNHNDYSNGVWCDNSTGAITKLQLSACLTGTLKSNSSLFKFHHLRYLNLSYNNFVSSSLLSEFGNLNKLTTLSLSSNGFLGQVPSSFDNLTLLSSLSLSGNYLTGSLPHVGNLTELSLLDLSDNYFSGSLNIKSGLFGLHNLGYLSLKSNNFSSSLPSEIGNLYKLEVLFLSSNSFLGQVPSTISNLTRLNWLFLKENELTGNFPLVQNMTELFTIQLSSNKFTGTVPSSLLNMPLLRHVNLQDNYLTGSFEIPNSSTSSSLESLLLGNNHFDGKILKPISKLISLKTLELTFLNTTHPIDLRLFSSFKSLSGLDLSGNNIDPTSLSSDSYIPLTLESLYLKECGISEFPTILKTLQNLDFMDIGRNQIKGKIPEWLWSLPRLRSVCLYDNHLSGFQGSSEVLVNSSVMVLMIDANKFEGKFPDLPLLINVVTAAQNNFNGEIPLSICNRSSLDSLELSENNFTGLLPQCLSNFNFLRLRKNNLEGSIPDVFLVGASLRTLDVGYNQITGKLPRSLLNCSLLMFFSVDNNNIEDTFPFSLKALPNLEVMILRSNKFYGPISPPDRGPLGFPKLRIFEIADNKFTGSLSPSYFVGWKGSSLAENEDGGLYMIFDKNINGLQYLYMNHIDLQYKGLHMQHARVLISYSAIDLSGNLLEGNIPESIGLLRKLIALNLSHNSFTGHIPSSLGNLKELESLDMSRNQLSGTIPNGLGHLSFLGFINVSHNQLTGEIPQGTQIIGQPASSFTGNVGLCSLPLKKSCFDTSKHEDEDEKEEEQEQVLNRKGVAVGYGLGVLFGLTIAQVIASYKTEWLAKRIDSNNA